ncbi:MAG TPA: TetR/AcrR family transcriptional regulator [Thermoleophilaceae bacterium]|jgi:AcrR family transcriptional regulator
MEAARATAESASERRLDSDKARRIVGAMRDSVARRGAAGSTFDHVAREAGVSRGLLHYYFGSKERLLVEVVRHDTEIRISTFEERLRGADSLDSIVAALVVQLREYVEEEPGWHAVIHELLSAARRNDEIRDELANLYRRVRGQIADILREKEADGIVTLRADAESVASIFLSIADGFEVQITAEPGWDNEAAVAAALDVARFLLGEVRQPPARP